MGWLAHQWARLSVAGNHFFSGDSEIRANTFVNRASVLFILVSITGLLTHLTYQIFVYHSGWIAKADIIAVSVRVVPAFLLMITIQVACFYLRNRTGKFELFNGIVYIAGLCFFTFLGILYQGESGLYLLQLMIFPLPLALWHMHRRWVTALSLALGGFAFFFCLWYTQNRPAFVELSPELNESLLYTSSFFLLVTFAVYMVYLVSGGHDTEARLIAERQKSDRLLNEIIPHLEQSEKRYEHLVEDSSDLIFSLTRRFEFMTINRAVTDILRYQVDDWIGRPFIDLVFDEGGVGLNQQIALTNLQKVRDEKQSVSFTMPFQARHGAEGVSMLVHFDYSEVEGRVEILGKATSLAENKIIEFLDEERCKFRIDNSLHSADFVSHRLTRNLEGKLAGEDLTRLRISLREMLINAIEHGNLAVTFEEKSQAQADGIYLDFLQERQVAARFRDRKVAIEYELTSESVSYVISDQGGGFDADSVLRRGLDDANEDWLEHGRGIAMTMHAFDEVTFNKKGNQVSLVKELKTK